METIEYRYHDKSDWGLGPWQDEPDKMQWQDAATGLPCLIVRNGAGALCGYVGVTEQHPWYGIGYNGVVDGKEHADDDEGYETLDNLVSVHGGVTFAGRCVEDDKEHGICHKPAPGEPDNVWWFGFDCHHYLDIGPAYEARSRTLHDYDAQYRDIAYVKEEVAKLATQLAAQLASGHQ